MSRLVKRLLPWQPEDGARPQSECVKVEDVMLMVDMLLDETAPDDKVSLFYTFTHFNDSYGFLMIRI